MNVLIIGSGGREHALAWKIKQSPLLTALHAIPGSAAIAELAKCPPIGQDDFEKIYLYCSEHKIDLVVVGPEVPLSRGISDFLSAKGVKVFGPSRQGARLEASKQYAKEFMHRNRLPTAAFSVLVSPAFAREKVKQNKKYPVVIKADGLAAGKGVRICMNEAQALEAVEDFMEKRIFGFSGSKVILEEFMEGREASVMALVDGKSFLMLPVSRDHKRLSDGDAGPNTGGMGAIAPLPLEPQVLETIRKDILQPFVDGIKKENIPFCGVIYAGLMLTADGPKLLEFNTRFGDPETQALMPVIKSDLLELLAACADGRLEEMTLETNTGECAAVVLSAGGYPENPEKGKEITGLGQVPDGVEIFQSGTDISGGKTITAGGRVLAVTARAPTLAQAREKVYSAVKAIKFEGMHYRTDIGL